MSARGLGLTERSIMERIGVAGKCTVTWTYGTGPRGGQISRGKRERAAADRLVEAGIAKVVQRGRYRADFGGTSFVVLKAASP